MAARFSLCSSPMTTPNHGPSMGPIGSLQLRVGCSKNHASVEAQNRIRSSHKSKIFEDGSAGIVCYRDENGEITCEGYDEGPRFHQKVSRLNCNTRERDADVIELLQRCWFQVADEGGDKGGK